MHDVAGSIQALFDANTDKGSFTEPFALQTVEILKCRARVTADKVRDVL
jgi:hypothetical protein